MQYLKKIAMFGIMFSFLYAPYYTGSYLMPQQQYYSYQPAYSYNSYSAYQYNNYNNYYSYPSYQYQNYSYPQYSYSAPSVYVNVNAAPSYGGGMGNWGWW